MLNSPCRCLTLCLLSQQETPDQRCLMFLVIRRSCCHCQAHQAWIQCLWSQLCMYEGWRLNATLFTGTTPLVTQNKTPHQRRAGGQ